MKAKLTVVVVVLLLAGGAVQAAIPIDMVPVGDSVNASAGGPGSPGMGELPGEWQFGAAPAAAGTVVITFDEIPPVTGNQNHVTEEYAHLGVHFLTTDDGDVRGGLSAGDPGNWDLEGTNGPQFLGLNGSSFSLTVLLDMDVSGVSVDVSRANGSPAGTTFTLAGYRDGLPVQDRTVTLGPVNDWTTVSLDQGSFDRLDWIGSGNYGVDNFTFVPEPATLALLGLGAIGLLRLRRRRGASLIAVTGLLAAMLSSPATAGMFAQRRDFPVGNGPNGLATADLNGDGRLDLAVSAYRSDLLTVLYGQPDGAFGGREDYPAQRNTWDVAIGDMDGDTRPDIAVTNNVAQTISVFAARPTGGFGPRQDYSVIGDPAGLICADVDLDGRLDLVTVSHQGRDVNILFGAAGGGYDPCVQFDAGRVPEQMVTGDFNRDGRPDLAVTNLYSDDVTVLYGLAERGFSSPVSTAVGDDAYGIASDDLDGDGWLDVVASNTGAGSGANILYGGPAGLGRLEHYPVNGGAAGVAIGDFDRDGLKDFAMSLRTNRVVAVWCGRPGGGFDFDGEYAVGADPRDVVAADFDGDGWLDLAVANSDSSSVSVLYNAIPEPATLGLLALGGLALLRRRPTGR